MAAGPVLLLSNSTQYGRAYLDHAEDEIRAFLGGRACVAFVPYALSDWDGYEARARERFARLGYELESVQRRPDTARAFKPRQMTCAGHDLDPRAGDALRGELGGLVDRHRAVGAGDNPDR